MTWESALGILIRVLERCWPPLKRRFVSIRRESAYLRGLKIANEEWRKEYAALVKVCHYLRSAIYSPDPSEATLLAEAVEKQIRSRGSKATRYLLSDSPETVHFALKILCLTWIARAERRTKALRRAVLPVLCRCSPKRHAAYDETDVRDLVLTSIRECLSPEERAENPLLENLPSYAHGKRLLVMLDLAGMPQDFLGETIRAFERAFPRCIRLCVLRRQDYDSLRFPAPPDGIPKALLVMPLSREDVKTLVCEFLGATSGHEYLDAIGDDQLSRMQDPMVLGSIFNDAEEMPIPMKRLAALHDNPLVACESRIDSQLMSSAAGHDAPERVDMLEQSLALYAFQRRSEHDYVLERSAISGSRDLLLAPDDAEYALASGLLIEVDGALLFPNSTYERTFAAKAIKRKPNIEHEVLWPDRWWKTLVDAVILHRDVFQDIVACREFPAPLLALVCDIAFFDGKNQLVIRNQLAQALARSDALDFSKHESAGAKAYELLCEHGDGVTDILGYIPQGFPEASVESQHLRNLVAFLSRHGFQKALGRIHQDPKAPLSTRVAVASGLERAGIRVIEDIADRIAEAAVSLKGQKLRQPETAVPCGIETMVELAKSTEFPWMACSPLFDLLRKRDEFPNGIQICVIEGLLQLPPPESLRIRTLSFALVREWRDSEKDKGVRNAFTRLMGRLGEEGNDDAEKRGGDSQ